MATTSSPSVHAASRELEERGKRLEALRAHLGEGAKQARRSEFVELDIGEVVARARKRIRR